MDYIPKVVVFQIPERRSSLFNIGNFATAMERFDGDGLGDKWSTGLWVTWYASIMAGVSCAMDSAGNRSEMLPTSSNQVEFVVLAGMAKGIVHRYWWHFRYIILYNYRHTLTAVGQMTNAKDVDWASLYLQCLPFLDWFVRDLAAMGAPRWSLMKQLATCSVWSFLVASANHGYFNEIPHYWYDW